MDDLKYSTVNDIEDYNGKTSLNSAKQAENTDIIFPENTFLKK
jgi:hypothetical protein